MEELEYATSQLSLEQGILVIQFPKAFESSDLEDTKEFMRLVFRAIERFSQVELERKSEAKCSGDSGSE